MVDHADDHIRRLRGWRRRADRTASLAFMQEQFRRTVERPHQQLGELVGIWEALVPTHLLGQTALVSMSRGTLRVAVADSSVLYELDRRLRGGLERDIRQRFRGGRLRIRLEVGPVGR